MQSRADGGFDNEPLVDVVTPRCQSAASGSARALHEAVWFDRDSPMRRRDGRVAWFLERVRDLTDLGFEITMTSAGKRMSRRSRTNLVEESFAVPAPFL